LVHQGIVDKATGYTAAQAITAALLSRERTGVGTAIEISMLDVAVNFLWPDGMTNHTSLEDGPSLPAIARSFRLTKTADGYVSIITITDRQWQGLVTASGVTEDVRAGTVEGRMQHGGDTMRRVKTRLAELSTADVVTRMSAHGVPCQPVVGLDEVRLHPQVVAAGLLEELVHPVLGRIVQPRPAARMSEVPQAERRTSPATGEHTDEILAEAGFSSEEIVELHDLALVA
jgi:crotonobetainyl-CoA:carnitine CoA-transferase CaiB-like acyl-CoA transferase